MKQGKGQINLEFLASAFVFILTVGLLITLGSDILPNFSGSVEASSTHMEAYTISTMVLSNPGDTDAGSMEWDATEAAMEQISFFGLSRSSEEYFSIDESKLRNISTYEYTTSEPHVNYSEFKVLTGAKNQYFFNFTWNPIAYSGRTVENSYSNLNLERDMLLYHEFEKDSSAGNNVPDSSDENNHGTNFGAEREVNGTYDTNAFRFTKTDGDHTTFPDLGMTNSSVSVAFWMNKEGSWNGEEHAFMIGSDNGADGKELRIGYNSGYNFMWSYYNGSHHKGITGLTPPQPDEWIHVAGTFNHTSKEWNLYLDGELESSNISDTEMFLPDQDNNGVAHGGSGDEFSFNGRIDEFRVYNRVLEEEEIAQLMDVRAKIDQPETSSYTNSDSESHFGMKRLDGEKFHYIITEENGQDKIYLAENWNFNESDAEIEGDQVTLSGRDFRVKDIGKTSKSGYSIFEQHIKEFGPARDSDSTVIRLERYGTMKGEPMKIEVLAW